MDPQKLRELIDTYHSMSKEDQDSLAETMSEEDVNILANAKSTASASQKNVGAGNDARAQIVSDRELADMAAQEYQNAPPEERVSILDVNDSKMGSGEGAIRGLVQGPAPGLISTSTGAGFAATKIPEALRKGSFAPIKEGFLQGRNEERQNMEIARRKYPSEFYGGEAVSLLSPMVLAGKIAKGGSKVAKFLYGPASSVPKVAAQTAVVGGLSAAESSDSMDEFALKMLLNEGVGVGVNQALTKGSVVNTLAKKAKEKAGNAFAVAGEFMTGVPKKVMSTYSKNADEVMDFARGFGGETANAEMADATKKSIMAKIQSARRELSGRISKAIEGRQDRYDVGHVINDLQNTLNNMNQQAEPAETKEIQSMLDRLNGYLGNRRGQGADGNISDTATISEIYNAKKLMNKLSSPRIEDGKIFAPTDAASRAAGKAARQLRALIVEHGGDIKDVDRDYQILHYVEKKMNKNLLSPDKNASELIAAGSGRNQTARKQLDILSKVTGKNVTSEADRLAAAQTFRDPNYLPTSSKGSVLAKGTVLGAAGLLSLGHVPYAGPAVAGAVALATSPKVLKFMIDSGRVSGKLLDSEYFKSYIKTPQGQQFILRTFPEIFRGVNAE